MLKKRMVELLLLGIIIVLSSYMYTVMDYSTTSVLIPSEQYFIDSNQEEFAINMYDSLFPDEITYITNTLASGDISNLPYTLSGIKTVNSSLYYELLSRRLEAITSLYPNLTLEVRESKNVYSVINSTDYRFLFLKDMTTVDLSYIEEGSAPLSNTEIAIDKTFAEKNNYQIGDTLTINETTYTISGFVLFPDYTLAMFGNELIMQNETQTFALVTNDQFESINESVSFAIGGVYQGDTYTDKTFKTDVIDSYGSHDSLAFISSIILTANNLRSGGVLSDIEGGKAMGLMMSVIIASIGLIIVGIMISKMISSQRGPIGILKSMGYKDIEIAVPYIIFIAILSIPAILLGYYLGFLSATPLKTMLLDYYLLPSIAVASNTATILISIILPFVFLNGLSTWIITKMLKESPVELLNPSVVDEPKKKRNSYFRKMLNRLKITSKLQHLLLYRSPAKLLAYLIGMFFAAYLILLSFAMTGVFDRTINQYYDTTNFNYIGICEFNTTCAVPSDAEGVIVLTNIAVEDYNVSVYGISSNSTMIPLYDSHGNLITSELSNGAIITKGFALASSIKEGDTITVSIGTKSLETYVEAITELYNENAVYLNIDDLSITLTSTTEYYNAVYSASELNSSDYLNVVSVDAILAQTQSMNTFMNTFVYMMVIMSIGVGAIIVYILTVLTIEDNFYNISLFKVLGYNELEINKMVLGGYNLYGLLSFLLTIPLGVISFDFMAKYFATYFNMQFPMKLYWWEALLSIFIYYVIFFAGAYIAKKNLNKISLQEAMKRVKI